MQNEHSFAMFCAGGGWYGLAWDAVLSLHANAPPPPLPTLLPGLVCWDQDHFKQVMNHRPPYPLPLPPHPHPPPPVQVRPKKPRARRGEAAAAAAGGREADDSDPLLSQPFSQPLSQQQRFLGSPGQPGQVLSQQQSWGMELGTQLAAGEGASQEPAPEPMSVGWMFCFELGLWVAEEGASQGPAPEPMSVGLFTRLLFLGGVCVG